MYKQTPDYDLAVGESIRDLLGHRYEVLAALGPRIYQVQPYTPVGTVLRPLGGPVTMTRSDVRKDGE